MLHTLLKFYYKLKADWLLLTILVIIISVLLVLLNYFEFIHIFDFPNHNIIIMDESKEEQKIISKLPQEPWKEPSWEDTCADITGIIIISGTMWTVGEIILDLIWRILNK